MINNEHVHNGHAYATLAHPFFKILKKQTLSFPQKNNHIITTIKPTK